LSLINVDLERGGADFDALNAPQAFRNAPQGGPAMTGRACNCGSKLKRIALDPNAFNVKFVSHGPSAIRAREIMKF
jgi:hypothetical protein